MFLDKLRSLLLPEKRFYVTLVAIFLVIVFWMIGTPFRNVFQSAPIQSKPIQSAPSIANQREESPLYSPPREPSRESQTLRQEVVPSPPPAIKIPTESIELRLIRSQNEVFAKSVVKLVEDYDQLSKAATNLKTLIDDLATNDTGRKIASDETLRGRAVAMLAQMPVNNGELTALGEQAIIYRDEIDRAVLKSPDVAVPDKVKLQVRELVKSVADNQKAIQKYAASLDAIIKQSASLELGSLTLDEVRKATAEEEAMVIAKATKQERDKTIQDNIDADNEAERKKQDAAKKLRAVEAEVAQKQHNEDLENKRLQAIEDRKTKQLDADFERDLPKIKEYLGSMFESGYMQPNRRHSFAPAKEAGPVSLSGLSSYGVFTDGEEGYSLLLVFFNDNRNDRKGKGPYPYYFGGALNKEQIAAVRPAQAFLTKYGSILVAKGYLSK